MNRKPLPPSTYSRVGWALIAGTLGLLAGLIAHGLAIYDRLVGIHY